MKEYFKQHWLFVAICLLFSFATLSQDQEALYSLIIKLLFYLVVCPCGHYLFIRKLRIDKRGPLKLYQSPVFWVWVPIIMVLFYVFA